MIKIFSIIFWLNISTVQILSQQPNFFPMNIGNEYQMYDGYSYQFGKIERDTTYLNGKTYFHLPSPFDFQDCRVDSEGNILSISRVFFGGPPSPEEYMVFKADAILDEVWPVAWDYNIVIDTGYARCIYVDSGFIFGKNRLIKGVLVFDASYYYYYFWLAEGIGLVREQYDDGTTSVLNYAKINGNIYGTLVSVNDELPIQPTELVVSQNYPNPFNGLTIIDVSFSGNPIEKKIILSIYNILGSKVFEDKYQVDGKLSVRLISETMNLSSGIYIYKVTYGYTTVTKKFLLLK
ncbi:MAG: T9SS type A sorting domain-containing protein [Ignavibacteriaceae bacterium]|nr:T9SS type A sorting domain-containing protein [Ignavibacteriaceae bacterium]